MSTLTQFQREPQIIKNYNNFVLKQTSGENSENNQDVEKSHLVVNWWHRRGRRMPMLRIFCIMWTKLPSTMALYRIPPWISCSDLTCHIWQRNNFNTVWVSVLHFKRHMSVSNKYVFRYLLISTRHTLWKTTKNMFCDVGTEQKPKSVGGDKKKLKRMLDTRNI